MPPVAVGSKPCFPRTRPGNRTPPMPQESTHTESLVGSIADKIDGFFYRCLNDKDFTMVHLSSGFAATLGYDADWFISTRQSFTGITHPRGSSPRSKRRSSRRTCGRRTLARPLPPEGQDRRMAADLRDRRRLPRSGAPAPSAYLDGVILDVKSDSQRRSARGRRRARDRRCDRRDHEDAEDAASPRPERAARGRARRRSRPRLRHRGTRDGRARRPERRQCPRHRAPDRQARR